MSKMQKARVLFVCTGNSCRSQMAEGALRHAGGDRFEAFSAGTHPSSVHPMAVRAMKEIGIDISAHRSKSVEEFLQQPLDYVTTVCGGAKEVCPFFPGPAHRLHWDLEDPAQAEGTEEEVFQVFRDIRDLIVQHVLAFVANVPEKEEGLTFSLGAPES